MDKKKKAKWMQTLMKSIGKVSFVHNMILGRNLFWEFFFCKLNNFQEQKTWKIMEIKWKFDDVLSLLNPVGTSNYFWAHINIYYEYSWNLFSKEKYILNVTDIHNLNFLDAANFTMNLSNFNDILTIVFRFYLKLI